jgi:NAD-dependent deacetylase sirtuin 4
MVLLMTLRRASSLAPRVAWKPKATLSGRLEGLLQAPAEKDDPAAAQRLAQWLSDKRNVVVLTGAGLSTDSGIPDYRGKAGSYRLGHVPIGHDEFMRNESSRRRYWARALVGYPAFAAAKPNDAHFAVAALEEAGVVSQVITQNVDGLHEAAGSRNVIPLHGRGYRVQCMSCGAESCRGEYHATLAARNPSYAGVIGSARDGAQALRPDADADVTDISGFDDIAPCGVCGTGLIKPAVTFFGDVVPKDRVEACSAALDDADGLLCIGTSLAVYSAFRFARRARDDGIPICILNRGPTRCDTEEFPDLTKVNAGVAALAEAVGM